MLFITDTCQVQNGGCDNNAICSHDGTSNVVVCTCKTGYANTGSAPNVTCTGESTASNTESCHATTFISPLSIDTCQVTNGACDANAFCSHDGTSNAVVCTCKTGYTNTGNQSNVVCTGSHLQSTLMFATGCSSSDASRYLSSEQWWMRCACHLYTWWNNKCSCVCLQDWIYKYGLGL